MLNNNIIQKLIKKQIYFSRAKLYGTERERERERENTLQDLLPILI
jgi:hypothetical protein